MEKPNKTLEDLAPWQNENATDFLARFAPWGHAIRLIHGTLQLDARRNPHETRAAAALVIMFCREGLWPVKDNEYLESVLELAVRQLSTIKQLYELKARSEPELLNNRQFRKLLTSIDEEIRILEARLSDPKPSMPNEPPCTWGEFWV